MLRSQIPIKAAQTKRSAASANSESKLTADMYSVKADLYSTHPQAHLCVRGKYDVISHCGVSRWF